MVYTSIWLLLPNSNIELNDCIEHINKREDLSIQWVKEILDNMLLLQKLSNPRIQLEKWKQITKENLKLS